MLNTKSVNNKYKVIFHNSSKTVELVKLSLSAACTPIRSTLAKVTIILSNMTRCDETRVQLAELVVETGRINL
jgi:hypothetical protein